MPNKSVPLEENLKINKRAGTFIPHSRVVNKWKNCGHTRQELRKLYHKRQPQVSKASAGKKVISFPLTVNLLEDGQGVTDITGPLLLLRPLGYAVDAETEGH